MPGGRARFTVVTLPEITIPAGRFHLSTRRGKQFNSMAYGNRDFLTGSTDRRDVLIHPEDARRLGIGDGQEILLRSETGEWKGIARFGPMKTRHLQAHWPEANVLISRRFDPVSGEPDYNALVTLEPADGTPTPRPVADREAEPVPSPTAHEPEWVRTSTAETSHTARFQEPKTP
jgi:anaerobic selenocysteine-containing dehydrogenase